MSELVKLAKEALRQQIGQKQDPAKTIQPGDRVFWQRGDLTWQTAVVDFLHIDADGGQWIFSTLPNGDQNTVNVKVLHHWGEQP